MSVPAQSQRFYVETLGCPKNEVDSEKIIGLLHGDGLQRTDDPSRADVVVVNTCAFIEEARRESIGMLQAKGVDAVIPFRAMLGDLVNQIEANRNYQKSDLLQVIRILKNYDFIRDPQLELFRGGRKRK